MPRNSIPHSRAQQLDMAREILRREQAALGALAAQLDDRFCDAVELCAKCTRHVVVTGMGKAGIVGQKIAASLSSLGTRSHFLHPAEAFHGDLGTIHPDDVVLVLSFSGNTEEVVRLIPPLRELGVSIVAMTGNAKSVLARQADVVIHLGEIKEACEMGLAPTTSTTAMMALGDALALVLSRLRAFQPEDFARFHPGGSLGRRLARVDDCMRPLTQCRVAGENATVREVLVQVGQPGRRTGAVMLLDHAGRLVGLFTDSDLARLFENHHDSALDRPIREVMTRAPVTVPSGTRLGEAIGLLASRRLSELPVVDVGGRPLGIVDITDVLDSAIAHSVLPSDNTPQRETRTTIPFDSSSQRESA